MRLGPFRKLTCVEFLLYLREPSAFFFTLVFPLMLMMLFGSIWGNEPFPGESYGYIDFSIPAFMGMVIATSGIMGLTTSMAAYREKGILRRFRASPVSPATVLLSELTALFTVTIGGIILLLLAGALVFGARLPGDPLQFAVGFLLSALSVSALGFIPASLAPTARSGLITANIMYFPMLFLSGAALPSQMLPSFLRSFSMVLPLTHAIRLMQGLWLGGDLVDYPVQIAVLTGVLVAGTAVSVRWFRWE